MTSVIERKAQLGTLFAKYPIAEVFATAPYDFENEMVHMFVCIATDCFDWYVFWEELIKIYRYGTLVAVTRSYDDPVLAKTQLIWKGGKWYV